MRYSDASGLPYRPFPFFELAASLSLAAISILSKHLTGKPKAFRSVLQPSCTTSPSLEPFRMQGARHLFQPIDQPRPGSRQEIIVNFVNSIVSDRG